jgi:hypothetical protein
VFVGYGAVAPEYKWDDFKGADLKGKILLILVNDPPAPPSEPTLFGGNAMTYYGRWTYKYEEAERRGAAGAIIVHRTDQAGYPFQVLVGSNSTGQRLLPRDPKLPPPLGVRGWITDSAATALLRQAGWTSRRFARRRRRVSSVPWPRDHDGSGDREHRVARDVGERRRRAARPRSETEQGVRGAVGALGSPRRRHAGERRFDLQRRVRQRVGGLDHPRHRSQRRATQPRPRRSLLFLFVTAEESGLLGSAYFAQSPTVPLSQIAANLNVDETNFVGPSRDVVLLGLDKSSLGSSLAAMLRAEGIRVMPKDHPERGTSTAPTTSRWRRPGARRVDRVGDRLRRQAEGLGRAVVGGVQRQALPPASDEYRPTST